MSHYTARMDRRTFLGTVSAGLLAAPLVAEAQQPGKVFRIGMLWLGSRETVQPFITAYEQSLRQLGYSPGQNLVVELRFADGHANRLPALASDLVRLTYAVVAADDEANRPWMSLAVEPIRSVLVDRHAAHAALCAPARGVRSVLSSW